MSMILRYAGPTGKDQALNRVVVPAPVSGGAPVEGSSDCSIVGLCWQEASWSESTLIANKNASIGKMAALRGRGIEVIIDDFGTGYSSLSYMSRLPVGMVKIDQTFVHNIDSDLGNQAIVETIVALGRALDIQLIAEGVETRAEQESLTGIGCHQYQGFLYSKPAPLDVLLQALALAADEAG